MIIQLHNTKMQSQKSLSFKQFILGPNIFFFFFFWCQMLYINISITKMSIIYYDFSINPMLYINISITFNFSKRELLAQFSQKNMEQSLFPNQFNEKFFKLLIYLFFWGRIFGNLTVEFHVYCVLNMHIKFCLNWMLFTI